jgi:hypothetical protein
MRPEEAAVQRRHLVAQFPDEQRFQERQEHQERRERRERRDQGHLAL